MGIIDPNTIKRDFEMILDEIGSKIIIRKFTNGPDSFVDDVAKANIQISEKTISGFLSGDTEIKENDEIIYSNSKFKVKQVIPSIVSDIIVYKKVILERID